MAAIVVCHVTCALLPGDQAAPSTIAIGTASSDPLMWLLVCLEALGKWGDSVFIICSAWFLCMSDHASLGKIVKLVLDVFIYSVAFLLAALLLGVRPGARSLIACLLPTTFANNWFITCYLLLYAIHPALNWVCRKLGKRGHCCVCVMLFCLYMLLPCVHIGLFFNNELVVMIAEYVIVAYGRYYLPKTLGNRRNAWVAFAAGTFGAIALVVLLEQAGLRVGVLSAQMFHFNQDGNPFLFASALGLFCLVKDRRFESACVNRLASLMLAVYLIHYNYFVRGHVLPAVWRWIHTALGYELLLVWIVLFAAVLFATSVFCAFLYKKTLGKGVDLVVPKIELAVRRLVGAVLDWACTFD